MYIIQSTQKYRTASVEDLDGTKVLTSIRELAERVSCCRKDMTYMPGRSNLLLLCAEPELAKPIDDLFHSTAMVRLSLTTGDSKLT